ncbi:SAM-dependent methyltransferase [Streptomyces sp. NPDC058861]|uniref:SAM-dependent methyltransferase n=1 Tax=Streptomyces sp. NPDC058861 TaxID=3346653 RepID=UPI0036A46C20
MPPHDPGHEGAPSHLRLCRPLPAAPAERYGGEDDWRRRPTVARITDHLMGGSDNYRVDREFAQRLTAVAPPLRAMVEISGAFRPRAVAVLADELRMTQFIELGCGLPSTPQTPESRFPWPAHTFDVARAFHLKPRVVYVDNDRLTAARAGVILAEEAGTRHLHADARDVTGLLASDACRILDYDQPVAVLAHDLLSWMDDADAARLMQTLREELPAGSAISVAHATTDVAPGMMAALASHYADAGILYRPRTLPQIRALLGAWTVLSPGILPTGLWRPDYKLPPGMGPSEGKSHGLPPGDYSHAYAAIITAP